MDKEILKQIKAKYDEMTEERICENCKHYIWRSFEKVGCKKSNEYGETYNNLAKGLLNVCFMFERIDLFKDELWEQD